VYLLMIKEAAIPVPEGRKKMCLWNKACTEGQRILPE